MPVLQSLIADRWVGSREGAALASAIDGATVYHAHADELDFAEALSFARRTGGAALLGLDFQQRAARLKALAAYLNERKEELYAISRYTGATRSDGDQLPHRSAGADDDGLGPLARGKRAARHRPDRRPARPPGQQRRRHLHRLGRHRPEAAQERQLAGALDPVQRRGRFTQCGDP